MTTKQRWVLALTSIATFMVSLDALVVVTAMSTIHRELDASLESLEWIVNAYNLSFAVLLMTGAALGDRFGRRRIFVIGLALFTAASAACALSPTAGALVAARIAQGIGAALVMPLALTQLTAAFPLEKRGRVLGIFSGVGGLAIFTGPFVGGAVAEGLAWQWIFWVNVPIGLIAIALVLAKLAESHGPSTRFDIPGNVLVTGASLGLVWALVRANAVGWSSLEVLASLAVGVVLLGGFVAWESHVASPMLPMRFFRIRAFSAANIASLGLYAPVFGVAFMMAQYLQNGMGYGPFDAGLRLMPWTGTLMICAPIAGALVDRLGERRFIVTGLLLQAAGLVWLGSSITPSVPYLQVIVPLIIAGCGVSMAMPAVQRASVSAVPLPDIGKASGAFMMMRFLGSVFGVAILTAVFAHNGGFESLEAVAAGVGPAIVVAGAIALIGSLAGLAVTGRPPATVSSAVPEELARTGHLDDR